MWKILLVMRMRKVCSPACVLLLLLLCKAELIEGRAGNVAFNENITLMAASIQIIRKNTAEPVTVTSCS